MDLLDNYVQRIVEYEKTIKHLERHNEDLVDRIHAAEDFLLKNKLALPPLGRRARDERKTQPLSKRPETGTDEDK